MVEMFKVGPDELSEWDLNEVKDDPRFEWFVYWYENGYYDGSGNALALCKDGLLYYKDLSHCSCYGPMEGWATGSMKYTVEQFFEDTNSIFDWTVRDEVKAKVIELLQSKTSVFDEKFEFLK